MHCLPTGRSILFILDERHRRGMNYVGMFVEERAWMAGVRLLCSVEEETAPFMMYIKATKI